MLPLLSAGACCHCTARAALPLQGCCLAARPAPEATARGPHPPPRPRRLIRRLQGQQGYQRRRHRPPHPAGTRAHAASGLTQWRFALAGAATIRGTSPPPSADSGSPRLHAIAVSDACSPPSSFVDACNNTHTHTAIMQALSCQSVWAVSSTSACSHEHCYTNASSFASKPLSIVTPPSTYAHFSPWPERRLCPTNRRDGAASTQILVGVASCLQERRPSPSHDHSVRSLSTTSAHLGHAYVRASTPTLAMPLLSSVTFSCL